MSKRIILELEIKGEPYYHSLKDIETDLMQEISCATDTYSLLQIKEVPTHGRLIDEADLRDRAYKRQIRDRISFNDALVLALMDEPTIIEASTEGTEERE